MENQNKKLYTKDSIESLDPLQFTRLRPGCYAGDTTYSTQLLVEIVSNAIDEFRLGHGNQIDVKIDKDIIGVRDYGQGFIPNSKREDGKTILEAAFSVLNTSGKYREDGTYEGTSLGSFGIGSKITTYLSHWLEVSTWRDEAYEAIHFTEGEFSKRSTGKSKEPTGTFVQWQPSEEFFTNTEVEIESVKKLFKTIVCLCPGLTINLNDNGKEYVYNSKQGLNDLVNDGVKDKEIIKNRFEMKYVEGKNKLDMVLTYTSNYSLTLVPYVNTGLTESGPHITQFKTLITKSFNKYLRDKKWIKEKDENLTGDDIQEGMYLVFNLTAAGVSYDAQVKSRITKLDMKPFAQAFTESFENWLNQNEKEIKIIADKAINARKAREAAKKARDNARDNTPKTKNKFLNLPTKLVDAWGKDRLKCELYITEGDSAANGLVGARNGETQAIFPIRGKIISARKQTADKVYANQEVSNIVKALGLDIDKNTGKLIYDKHKLRYGKIIFAADADADGQAIKNLLITCFWWLCPTLFAEGHIYVAVPPLFRITTKKNEYIYLKDGTALEQYKSTHLNEKFQINRAKGLGEQSPDELEYCLLAEDTRNIQQLEVSDMAAADNLLEVLMGTSVPPRREYLLKYGEEAEI